MLVVNGFSSSSSWWCQVPETLGATADTCLSLIPGANQSAAGCQNQEGVEVEVRRQKCTTSIDSVDIRFTMI